MWNTSVSRELALDRIALLRQDLELRLLLPNKAMAAKSQEDNLHLGFTCRA